LVSIDVDDEFNKQVSKEAMKRYHDMEEWLEETRDPNPELTPMWLNWTFNFVSRKKCLRKLKRHWLYTWRFHRKAVRTSKTLLPSSTRPKAAR
jgi:hypothetical protein